MSSSTLHLKSSNRDDLIPLSQITGLRKYPVPCKVVFFLIFFPVGLHPDLEDLTLVSMFSNRVVDASFLTHCSQISLC